MLKKPASCLGCNLYRSGNGFVKPDGDGTSGLFIIGSHNGPSEEAQGVPFVKYSAGGSKLEEIFKFAGVQRKDFKLANIIQCQPPGDRLEFMPFEPYAIAHCREAHLKPLLKGKKNVILALGSVPLRELTNFKNGGKKENVSSLRGFVLPSEYGYVIPSFDPVFIRKGKPQFIQYSKSDLQRALLTIRSSFTLPTYDFNQHPSYDDIKSFYYRCKDNPNNPIAYDIETEDSADTEEDERQGLFSNTITRIQFSLAKNQGITFPWQEQYFKLIQLFFLLPNWKLGFNCYNFDDLRIRDKGFRISSKVIDLMWMFKHHHPGLERGLQKVASFYGYPEPWKHHSGDREEWYACHDVSAPHYIWENLVREMKEEGTYGNFTPEQRQININISSSHINFESSFNSSDHSEARGTEKPSQKTPKGFLGHVVEFWPILDKARETGLAVNKEKLDNLGVELEKELKIINKELQGLIPDELKNLEPKRKEKDGTFSYGFKKPPKKPLLTAWEAYCNIRDNWNSRNLPTDKFLLNFTEFLNSRIAMEVDNDAEKQKATGSSKAIKYYELFERPVLAGTDCWKPQWFRRLEFKPSSQQVQKYIEFKNNELKKSTSKYEQRLAAKYKVPEILDIKTKQLRKSTGSKALETLLNSTGDEVIRLIVGDKDTNGAIGKKAGLRSVQKILKNDIPNWIPAEDGRVHTTWGIVAASGQLDARNPNILNASKHKPLGKIFRRVIEAPPGEIYVECDKKSYHVATMGYAADDPSYIRFSQLDPHSFFTAYVAKGVLGIPNLEMSDEEILDICKRYKRDEKWSWVRQHTSKVIVLGNQLGLGPRKIFINQNSLVSDPITKKKIYPFSSIEYVKSLQTMIAKLFPKVERFKTEVKRKAHSQKKLINEFGYKQDFFEVYTYKFDSELQQITKTNGSEAEKAIAFEVQSPAFGDIRDKLLQLQNKGLLEKYPFVVSIHDSFGFMFEQRKFDNFIADVYPILVSPSRVLVKPCCPQGLVVGVEISYGRNWQAFDPITNPEGMKEFKI